MQDGHLLYVSDINPVADSALFSILRPRTNFSIQTGSAMFMLGGALTFLIAKRGLNMQEWATKKVLRK